MVVTSSLMPLLSGLMTEMTTLSDIMTRTSTVPSGLAREMTVHSQSGPLPLRSHANLHSSIGESFEQTQPGRARPSLQGCLQDPSRSSRSVGFLAKDVSGRFLAILGRGVGSCFVARGAAAAAARGRTGLADLGGSGTSTGEKERALTFRATTNSRLTTDHVIILKPGIRNGSWKKSESLEVDAASN